METKNGSDTTPNSVVNAALTYLTPLKHRLQSPPAGAERFASEIGLAVGNFLQWIAPPTDRHKAKEFVALFAAILSEARSQSELDKFPVRLTDAATITAHVTITFARNDGKPLEPITVTLGSDL